MIAVAEGYSIEEPVADDDWEDVVGFELTSRERERHDLRTYHNLDGWLAHEAGSRRCLALGHIEPEGGWEEDPDEEHRHGFDGDVLCLGTIYGACCTECEGECGGSVEDEVDRDDLWALPGVRGRSGC